MAVVQETTVSPAGTTRIQRINGKVTMLHFTPNMPPAQKPSQTTCTDCGAASDKLRWYPFAAHACPACAAKRDAAAKREKQRGEVCPRCKKPFSLCTH